MKLVWSPEKAMESYVDTINSCDRLNQSGEAEFIAATAGGYNAKLIVEAWAPSTPVATSIGLSVAARHTGGRHVCIVANQLCKHQYFVAIDECGVTPAPEVMVGEVEDIMADMDGVDFLVVDCRRGDLVRVLRSVKVGQRGAVFVCRNVKERRVEGFGWDAVVGDGLRVVRSVVLPMERGLDIAHVGYGGGHGKANDMTAARSKKAWVKHVDVESGEEIVYRRG